MRHLFKPRLGASLILATAAAAAIGLGPAASAAATPTTSSAGVAIVPASDPSADAACTGTSSNLLAAVIGDKYDIFWCAPGTVTTAGTGPYYELDETTSNRVWFHQNASGSGWADCYSHAESSTLLEGRDQNPGNIQVSANTAGC